MKFRDYIKEDAIAKLFKMKSPPRAKKGVVSYYVQFEEMESGKKFNSKLQETLKKLGLTQSQQRPTWFTSNKYVDNFYFGKDIMITTFFNTHTLGIYVDKYDLKKYPPAQKGYEKPGEYFNPKKQAYYD